MARRKNLDFDLLSRELQRELERMWLRSKEIAYEQVREQDIIVQNDEGVWEFSWFASISFHGEG